MARHRARLRHSRILLVPPVLLFACLVYSWTTLPDVRPLRVDRPGRTAFMELRAAEARAAGQEPRESRRWVPYERLSTHLTRAVLLAEDAGFWGHDGVDYTELRASIETGLQDGMSFRGASTITQQLAKNLYLSPSRNPYRKLVELQITRRLEAELSKTRILELYLNVVEWGDGIWGADAAAREYFGRSASDLTPTQAALMAGALINPRVYTPARPNARLLARQRIILRRMGRAGAMPSSRDPGGKAAAAPSLQTSPPAIAPQPEVLLLPAAPPQEVSPEVDVATPDSP